MTLEGRSVGSLVAQHRLQVDPEPGDLSVLRILANQAAVSLHTSEQYQAGLALHRRAQRLYDEATAQARNLADRTAELRQVEERLLLAHQRELVDGERHRIARELHDSVTQYVLSAGMAVEIARGEAEALGRPGLRDPGPAGDREEADPGRRRPAAAGHLRPAPAAPRHRLHAARAAPRGRPPAQAAPVGPGAGRGRRGPAAQRRRPRDRPHGRGGAVQRGDPRAGQPGDRPAALRADQITVSVADDGEGDPTDLSRKLRLERATMVDGRHRGLVNMESRIGDLGGSLAFRRARLGGVRVEMRIPLPLAPAGPGPGPRAGRRHVDRPRHPQIEEA